MDYLIKRIIKNEQIDSDNEKMYDEIKKRFEKAYECTLLIEQVFDEKLQRKLNKEERLYLMLHINRMCTRV
jgi:beta-glucoside operon transcriptional antiterminator